jgi:hypothetical protein
MNTTTRKSARLQKLNEIDRQSISPTNLDEFSGMTSTSPGTGTDHPTQLPEVEPQPQDCSTTTGQVAIEDPNPSEDKEAPITVVDLTNKEAIEDPTRSTTPIMNNHPYTILSMYTTSPSPVLIPMYFLLSTLNISPSIHN